MRIPKSFVLAGIRWQVEESPTIDELGLCSQERATITLRTGLVKQVRDATFCHELEHAIRYTCGHSQDEQEVEAQGNILHQFLVQFAKEQRNA